MKRKKRSADTNGRLNVLQRFSLFFFKHAKTSVFLWVAVLTFGIACYTTFLQRQGFPAVDIPYSVVSGTYFVNSEAKVDQDLGKPISTAIAKVPEVKTVTATADKNVISFVIQYKEGTTSQAGSQKVEAKVKQLSLPATAKIQYQTVDAGRFNNKYDLIISTYADTALTTSQLTSDAQQVAGNLRGVKGVAKAEVIEQSKSAISPATGKTVTLQDGFDRVAVRNDIDELQFHNAVSVGVVAKPGTDALKLYDAVHAQLDNNTTANVHTAITADFAENIRQQVSDLQKNLGEGLLIVIIVSFLLISWRAGLATALSMITVLFMTVGALKLFGYTLNTITLFALILSLGLIVDDTTIVAEAIDANQAEGKSKHQTVADAVRRVARASLAGTLVTIMTFAPMLFIGGILGNFIRALPVTIITSLALSLLVSLSIIPFLSRPLILGKKVRTKQTTRNPVLMLEHLVSSGLAGIIRRSAGHRARQVGLALVAFAISAGFLVGSFSYFSKLKFDIFPTAKDGDALTMSLTFRADTTLPQAEAITDHANDIVGQTIGSQIRRVEYLSSGSTQTASAQIDLVPYTSRDVTAPQLQQQLQSAFADFTDAKVQIDSAGVGPPRDAAPFHVQIQTEDAAKANALATDLVSYLQNHEVTRQNGTKVKVIDAQKPKPIVTRKDGKRIFDISAGFAADDTSALVTLAQKDVQNHFDAGKLATYGLSTSNLKFDFGSEQENQDSFKSMMMAFPVLLLAMFILLALFFRSLLQPVLIFMAIPFSFLGVAAGLHYSDNPLSFFVMIGFFALIGIAVNNTIMLVDYANQARRAGKSYTESMAEAVGHRFRPLLTTSLTSVVALTPLALSDPFWQSLAVTLIFGLLSSTFLVIVSFPYYWLAAEWLRLKTKRFFRRLFRRPGQA